MPHNVIAALDIGGTKIAGALVDRTGAVIDQARVSTPAADGPAAVLATAAGLLRTLTAGHPDVRIAGLGVGSAGVIEPTSGVVLGATDALPGWVGTDIRGVLETSLDVPVIVRNDVHVHALGEAFHGAGTGCASVLFVAVGTGVGGGFVHRDLPGRLLLGAHAAAGHIGHLPSASAAGHPCSCGGTGHLEALASGPALVRELERRTGDVVLDLREVARRADQGDPHAVSVVDLGGREIGAAIGGLINTLDPDIVVVGGGVVNLGERWWVAVQASAARELLPALRSTPLALSSLGDDAALLGAAALASEFLSTGPTTQPTANGGREKVG